MARNSFAPDEIPSTKGPAIGFRKNVWIRNPERDRAPPKREARAIRGRRIFQIMLYAAIFDLSPLNKILTISSAEMLTLPIWMLNITEARRSMINSENTTQERVLLIRPPYLRR